MPIKSIYEFAGLPGSGKTTIAKMTLSKFNENSNSVNFSESIDLLNKAGPRYIGKRTRRIISYMKFPVFSSLLYLLCIKSHGLNRSKLIGVQSFIDEYEAYKGLKNTNKNSYQLLDEGPIHWVFSITFGGVLNNTETIISALFKICYKNVENHLIWLKVDQKCCSKRVLHRSLKTSRFNNNSSVELLAELEKYPYQDILAVYKNTISRDLIVLDGNRDAESVSVTLSEELHKRLCDTLLINRPKR